MGHADMLYCHSTYETYDIVEPYNIVEQSHISRSHIYAYESPVNPHKNTNQISLNSIGPQLNASYICQGCKDHSHMDYYSNTCQILGAQ